MNNFEKLNLYPHNIEASQKVKKQFDDGAKTVSIIHATGTGKSYNALYLALEYKDEKIIWLVPNNSIKEHIEKTINDNPNLDMKRDFPNLEIKTYQSLINLTKKELGKIPCDFLIIDEFHHLGAPVWGERVKTFVENHKNLKIFGMTAYNVNYRGTIYERDLTNPETDEIFSDTVESVYDLYDAMIDGVLPKPITKSVITEDSEIIKEIKEKIKVLKNKNDKSYQEYEKMISDVVKIIHKQNGVKELIQQSVKPNGKYIYFCPVFDEEGKNDINTIMETMKSYLQEKYPHQKIVFYKSTSADGEYGKHNRDCFYYDKDLDGNDVSNAIKIIFVKNQYNEGVHAPNVDGVFLGRKTRSDIVAFEQIGRALSVRGNTHEKMEEYSHYNIETLKQLAIQRGIPIKETDDKNLIIEKLISPIIIDLADNIDFIQELETNLGTRIKEYKQNHSENKRIIKITDSTIDIDVVNKDLFKILEQIRTNLNSKTWNDWYELAKVYYDYHRNLDIPTKFKTTNGYEFDDNGLSLGMWCALQRHKQDRLAEEQKEKLKSIGFDFGNKKGKKLEWNKWYELAKVYYDHHGNSEIPYRFKTINGHEFNEDGYNLGIWCKSQREKRSKLTNERREKLKKINFRFISKRSKENWEFWYNLLVKYYEYYGTSDVPLSFITKNGIDYDEDGFKLGSWVNNTRTKQYNLTPEERKQLESIKFRFTKKERGVMPWESWYELASLYYQHYGNSEIPNNFKTKNGIDYDEEGVALGYWCNRQKKYQKKLSNERRKKLEAIKFNFGNRRNILTWEEWYELATIYYQHHGNTEISRTFKTTNGFEFDESGLALGMWWKNQKDNINKLTKDKLEKLKLLNFQTEIGYRDIEWNKKYELLLIYYKHYGNTEMPRSFKTKNGIDYDESGIALGVWCKEQRKRQNELTEERKEKLQAIQFRFESNFNDVEWNKWYQLALNHYKYYGNLEIPRNFKTKNGIDYDKDGFSLGQWCHRQRKDQDKLSEERRKKLESIGFMFEKTIYQARWEKCYDLAKTYYEYYGNTEIPKNFKTINGIDYDESGIALGVWCQKQRVDQNNLTKERRKKLELIEFVFDNKRNKINWNHWYNLLVNYYEHYGNSDVSLTFITKNGIDYDKDGFKLGYWVNNTRVHQDNLTEERQKKLESVKFRFDKREDTMSWEDIYNLAKIYYSHYGNTEIRTDFITKNGIDYDENGVRLGVWCIRQRGEQEKLSEERREKLKSIGFRFEKKINQMNWNVWYDLLLKYYHHYGNSNVQRNFKTKNGIDYDESGRNLGEWCNEQRRKNNKLTEIQIEKLNLIEFRFITKVENETKKKELCTKYGLDYNKHKYLQNISYQELYAKIMYILENKYPLEIEGQLNEIFTMSNPHLQMKYNITKEELITKYYINNKERGI